MRSQQAALCQRAANRELSLFACAKAEVAVVGRIGLSPSYKPSATLKRRTFSLKHGVCSKGATDMHVSYMTCHLYRYMFYPWYIATLLRVTCCLVRP